MGDLAQRAAEVANRGMDLAEKYKAERNQLDQQVEALLAAIDRHRCCSAPEMQDAVSALYAAADQVRKERGTDG